MVARRPFADGRATRLLVAVPMVAIVATDAAYLSLIRSQGDYQPNVLTVPLIAAWLGIMFVVLGASLIETPGIVRARPALRGAASGGLWLVGYLSLFSIGLPLIISAALVTAATVITLVSQAKPLAVVSALVAAVVAIVALGAGLELSWRYIQCPPTGEMQGSTAGLFTGGFTYQCIDGVLTTR